jgi:hypothetical protein
MVVMSYSAVTMALYMLFMFYYGWECDSIVFYSRGDVTGVYLACIFRAGSVQNPQIVSPQSLFFVLASFYLLLTLFFFTPHSLPLEMLATRSILKTVAQSKGIWVLTNRIMN